MPWYFHRCTARQGLPMSQDVVAVAPPSVQIYENLFSHVYYEAWLLMWKASQSKSFTIIDEMEVPYHRVFHKTSHFYDLGDNTSALREKPDVRESLTTNGTNHKLHQLHAIDTLISGCWLSLFHLLTYRVHESEDQKTTASDATDWSTISLSCC